MTTNVVRSFHVSPPADGAHWHGAVVRPNHGGDVPEDLLVSLDIALCDHKSSNTRRFPFYENFRLELHVVSVVTVVSPRVLSPGHGAHC